MAGLVQDIDLMQPDLPILRYWRDRGKKAFEQQGVPTVKTEAWRYTKPRDLNSDDFVLSTSLPIITCSQQEEQIPFPCYPIIFENGIFSVCINLIPVSFNIYIYRYFPNKYASISYIPFSWI